MDYHSDVQGLALKDYWLQGNAEPLYLNTSYHAKETMQADVFFRDEDSWPDLEQYALSLCKGKILDIGAGAGAHSLWLQEKGLQVVALDLSALSVEVMKARGVANTICSDIFRYDHKGFDSLLLLMNGIGLAGTLEGLQALLAHFHHLLKPGGQILLDSSDISYLYDEHLPMPKDRYMGQVSYQYEYLRWQGDWFNWLYLDAATLKKYCAASGWELQLVFQGQDGEYLARLIRR